MAKSSSLSSTALVGLSTFLSRLLGFVRVSLIANYFGAGLIGDVINRVFNIPNNLRKLLAEGALSSAFIPVLSRSLEEDPSRARARELVRSLTGFQTLILVPLTLAAVFFAGPITRILTPFSDPYQQALAQDLFPWMMQYLWMISLSALLMGVLNSHERFLLPSLAPLWFSISVVLSLWLFEPLWGVHALTIGILAGGLGQIAFQLPAALKRGYSLWPSWNFQSQEFRRTLKQWAPTILTSLVFTLGQEASLYLANLMSTGSVSALTNALVFWQLPQGVLGASVATVLFPRFSRLHATNPEAADDLFGKGLELLALLLMPAALFLHALGEPMVRLALERGAFQAADTRLTAEVLGYFAWGLWGASAFNLTTRYNYAQGFFRGPLVAALLAVAVDLSLSLSLGFTALGPRALALGNTVSHLAGLGVFLFWGRQGRPGWSALGQGAKILASLIPTAVLWFWYSAVPEISAWPILGQLGAFLGVTVLGAALILGLYRLWGWRWSDLLPRRGAVHEKSNAAVE